MKRHLAAVGLLATIALPGVAFAADLMVDEAPLQPVDETAWDTRVAALAVTLRFTSAGRLARVWS